jgi:hypothetical protein
VPEASTRRPIREPAAERRRSSRRLHAARLRAHRAKFAFVVAAAAVFVTAMIFARISYAGHSKHRTALLIAPRRFLGIVRANRLQAGVVAAPTAPPAVVSAPS